MGRSSKEQADESRRRIVAEAGNLFRSRGYDAVGIAYVMKAAGMTQRGFYKHFASKERRWPPRRGGWVSHRLV
jgi:TetR/AcrR family transcriptional repressor of nem operon